MILIEARIGNHKINNNKIFEYLQDKLDKAVYFLEKKEGDTFIIKSTETNVVFLPDGDKRIKQLGRKYLYTHAFLPGQKEFLLNFLSRNNISVTWSKSPEEWVVANKTRAETEAV